MIERAPVNRDGIETSNQAPQEEISKQLSFCQEVRFPLYTASDKGRVSTGDMIRCHDDPARLGDIACAHYLELAE
jgi:hypothetical protein